MFFFRRFHPATPRPPRRARLQIEALESRLVPYALSGNQWPHPELITISFVPDGTNINGYASNLFATFNAKFGSASAWQNAILKAAQVWAQQANINFAVVADSGADSGAGDYQQGDPTFGDIRIGGYNYGCPTLAMAYMPPPVNNYSIAGDFTFNTGQVWNLGTNYDVFTVAMHEFGHALGLGHSTSSSAAMYSSYNGVKNGLSSDDINGIRAIYGARPNDAFDAAASNGSFSAATNITSLIDSTSLTALVTGLDITTTADVDYYQFTAPSGGTGQVTVNVQSQGLSLLAPVLKVYNGGRNLLKSVSGLNQYGTTLTATVSVTAGQTYYVLVDGADNTAFGTGAYALTLNFGTGPSPTVPLPNTATPNGSPLSGGGGFAEEDHDAFTKSDSKTTTRNMNLVPEEDHHDHEAFHTYEAEMSPGRSPQQAPVPGYLFTIGADAEQEDQEWVRRVDEVFAGGNGLPAPARIYNRAGPLLGQGYRSAGAAWELRLAASGEEEGSGLDALFAEALKNPLGPER
ncbi:MAG TPA: matrixin family metalloprotease [Gemmataceae bacterium]|nr:matrixin family metalloprotease [Gemmataceae bacterium]